MPKDFKKLDKIEFKKFDKIGFRRCIFITFRELIKDLPYIPIGLITLSIAPWRIIDFLGILRSQIDRVPSFEGFTKIVSRRKESFKILREVLETDTICLLITLSFIVRFWKIPLLFRIYYNFLKCYNDKVFSFLSTVIIEIGKSYYSSQRAKKGMETG